MISSAFSDVAKEYSSFKPDMLIKFKDILSNYNLNVKQITSTSLNNISTAVIELQKSLDVLKSQLYNQTITAEKISFNDVQDKIADTLDTLDKTSNIIDDRTVSIVKEHLSSHIDINTIINILALILSIISCVSQYISDERESQTRQEFLQQATDFTQIQTDLLQDIYELIITIDN